MKIKNYVKAIRKYGFKSVFMKNFLTFSLVLIIPFGILSLVIYNSSSGALEAEEINLSNERTSHISLAGDNFIKSMSRSLSALMNHSSIQRLMQAYDEEYISATDTYNDIISRLSTYALSYDYITTLGVYADKIGSVVTNTTYGKTESDSDSYVVLYESLGKKMEVFCEKTSGTYTDIVFCQKFIDLTIPRGICFIKVDINKFFENLGISTTNHNNILAVCKDGDIILASDISMIGDKIDDYYSPTRKTEHNGISYICTKLEGETGYDYYYLGNESMYNLATSNLVQLSAIMIVFILIMSILISIFFSAKFYRPLSEIIDKLQGYAKSYDENSNEITYITSNILDIGSENLALNKEIQDNLILLNNTQLNMLQNQINPHFLHNTLETIKWFVVDIEDDDDKASSMIEKLSKILRYSLENNEYIVDTETELEYTRTYIEILQIRYENMFTIEWDINPEAENAKIMKLSLQPIIENAIMHGIIPRRDEKGKIAIRIRKSDADLIVDIEDNGVGIPESKIAELRKLINDGTVKSKHGVGISNVNQRIKLIYGDEYGIELYSDSKKTVVSMRMKS
ncbi:MAG: histidine kinase [Clostridia bacterium]|nr:histidine kinase [Clostridia bacterium]